MLAVEQAMGGEMHDAVVLQLIARGCGPAGAKSAGLHCIPPAPSAYLPVTDRPRPCCGGLQVPSCGHPLFDIAPTLHCTFRCFFFWPLALQSVAAPPLGRSLPQLLDTCPR